MATMLPATPFYRPSWEETVRVVVVLVRPSDRAVPLYSLHCWDLVWAVAVAVAVEGAPVVDQRQQPRRRTTSVPLVQQLQQQLLLPARRICWVLKSVNS